MKKHLASHPHASFFAVLLILGSFSITGCGESLPETVNVHGKVTWQGKPLSNGMVTFEPVDNGENPPLRPAKGYTDAQGAYQLSTFRTNDGAMPGHYKILVHALGSAPSIEAISPASIQPTPVIPIKYGRSDTSDLAATITTDGPSNVELNFDLVP